MANALIDYEYRKRLEYELSFDPGWFSIQDNCRKIVEAENSEPLLSAAQSRVVLERSFSIWAGTMCDLPGPSKQLTWKPEPPHTANTIQVESVRLKEVSNIFLINWHNHIFALKDGEVFSPLSHRRWPLLFSGLARQESIIEEIANPVNVIDSAFIAHSDTPHESFGHFVMDYIPQFSFCHDLGRRLDIILPEATEMFQSEFLGLIKAGKDWAIHNIPPGRCILVKTGYYVETPTPNLFTFYRASAWAIDFFRQLGLNHRVPDYPSGDILFIARPRRRDLANSNDLISKIEDKGRKVTKVVLEKLNVYEKIAIFSSHRHLVGIQGSGFAMLPFLGIKGCTEMNQNMISEICPHNFGGPQYAMISNRIGLKHQIFSLLPCDTDNSPLEADVELDPEFFVDSLFEPC